MHTCTLLCDLQVQQNGYDLIFVPELNDGSARADEGLDSFWIPPLWQNQEHQEKHLFDSWTGNMNKSQVIIQVSKGLPSNLWVRGFHSILMNVWLGRIQRQFTEWNFLLATSYWHFHVLFICQLDTQKYCLDFEGEVCRFRSTVFTEECSMISENHLSKGF